MSITIEDVSRYINQIDPVDKSESFLEKLELWEENGRWVDEEIKQIDDLIYILEAALKRVDTNG